MEQISLSDVIKKDLVILDHEPFKNKDEMFEYLSEQFEKTGFVSNKKSFKLALENRERQGSTYIGDLIAIPHGKCREVLRPAIAFCRCNDEFMYESCDESGPVKYIFMLAIINNDINNKHLMLLASIARLLMKDEFKESLEKVKTYEELINEINSNRED